MHWVLHLISFFIISFNPDDKPVSWVMVFLFYAWIICSSGRSVSLYKITDLRGWGRAWTQRLFSEPGLWATACSTIRTRVFALLLLREPCTSPPGCSASNSSRTCSRSFALIRMPFLLLVNEATRYYATAIKNICEDFFLPKQKLGIFLPPNFCNILF